MLARSLFWARENDHLPWCWIVDETRAAERISTWSNPEEIIEAAVSGYRKNYWDDQPAWIEVWSEKGTVRGTLAPILKKYGVTFRVLHGYGSATALHNVADETQRSDKSLEVLYVGDWDPSGLHMSAVDLPDRLDRYGADACIERIALNENDVLHRDLPAFEALSKRGDTRYEWFVERYGHRCWELDALSPVTLRERVEAEIKDRLVVGTWDRSMRIEAAERSSMEEILRVWPTISGQARNCSEEGPT